MGVLDDIEALPLYERAQKKKRMAASFREWGMTNEADMWEAEGQREWPDPPAPSASATPEARAPKSALSCKREPGEVNGLREGMRTLRRSAAGAIRSALGTDDTNKGGNKGSTAEWLLQKILPKSSAEDKEKGLKVIRDLKANHPFFARLRDARTNAKEQANSPDNLGLLGEIGLLTEDEQKAWLKGERIAADRSVVAGRETLQRADAAAEIFAKGAPGKPMHPWIAERRQFGQKAVANAENRLARVAEMERGERPPARKSAWRALIENSTSGIVSGATKMTLAADAIGDLTAMGGEVSGSWSADEADEVMHFLPDIVVQLGDLIADKTQALFPGDPARRDEATQALAKRAAQMLTTVGGAGAAAMWQDRRRAKRSAKALAGEDK